MAENGSSTGLTPKQQQLIAALIAGNTIQVAAKVAGVGERTAHAWLKLPIFQQEYRAAKQAVFDEKLDMLKDGITTALKTLAKHMTDEDTPPQVQVRAAQIWLEQSLEIHKMQAFEQRLAELEQKAQERSQ